MQRWIFTHKCTHTHTHINSTAVCVPCAGGSSCFQIPPKTLSVDKADGWLWRTAGKPRSDESFGISVGLCGYLPDIGPKSLCNTLKKNEQIRLKSSLYTNKSKKGQGNLYIKFSTVQPSSLFACLEWWNLVFTFKIPNLRKWLRLPFENNIWI